MDTVSQLLPPPAPASSSRQALRQELRQRRRDFLAQPGSQSAHERLAHRLLEVLHALEPQCLGLYWPQDAEFDAPLALQAGALDIPGLQLALPYAYREASHMVYRRWGGEAPALKDECGIPSCQGAAVEPDVVLVPCVGFNRQGFRLGYGGGYFDRWLAAHSGVTSVGLAWSCGEAAFAVEPHDQALTLLITEAELIAP